jgi:hypothetical protein
MFWQVIAHLIGDYMLQSDWMAAEKTKKTVAALAHVVTYTIPFFFLTGSLPALAVIAGTHFVIDRWRLARYICWAKNWLAPAGWNRPWAECQATGYTPEKPPFLSVWLLIIVDNTLHVLCNATALRWL